VEYLPTVFQTKIGSGIGDIKYYASHLKTVINGIKQSTGAEKVDIIGYSMGGLVARWYYQKLDGSTSTGKLIMLATPNHGAEPAAWTMLNEDNNPNMAIVQMKPHSSFLQILNGYNELYCPNKQPNKFPSKGYITIASNDYLTADFFKLFGYEIPGFKWGDGVVPYDSVRLPHVYNQNVHGSHLSLPDNGYVVSQIKIMLQTNDNQYNDWPRGGS